MNFGEPGRPLRVLMTIDAPLDRRLGAAKAQMALADAIRAEGHKVDLAGQSEIGRGVAATPVENYMRRSFSWLANRYVAARAGQYDVIDVNEGNLTWDKRQLRFDGVLAVRTHGLRAHYAAFSRTICNRWPQEPRGSIVGRAVRTGEARSLRRASARSWANCDLALVLNEDEAATLRREPGSPPRVAVVPNGVNPELFDALAPQAQRRSQGQRAGGVVTIGSWTARKGARDLPELLRLLRSTSTPPPELSCLGTGTASDVVIGSFHSEDRGGVSAVASFDPDSLPALLANSGVGVFPSYIEGFGLGVVEQLSAGVPCVAYDVPGPRQILSQVSPALLVPRGDVAALAAAARRVRALSPPDYGSLSLRCREVAASYTWSGAAAATCAAYLESAAAIRR